DRHAYAPPNILYSSITRPSAPMVGRAFERPSPSSTGRWHDATWSSPSPRRGTSSGSESTQTCAALGHRGWNRQPDGGLIGEGTSPTRRIRSRRSDASGSGTGTADNSAFV